ncbi:hypothetical protein HAX54_001844, partial [Datura stramonium]|nr:hypothetical protein [Datura stramonium]
MFSGLKVMDLGVFETFGLKLKKKECTKQELKRKKIVQCHARATISARRQAIGDTGCARQQQTGATGRATRSKAGKRPSARRLCPSAIRHAQQHSPSAMGRAHQHWTRQQLGATWKRLPTPKNGSPTSTRKRNFKFIKEQAKHKSTTINTPLFP